MRGKSYQEGFFDTAKLQISDEQIVYENIEADSVIFCDGFGAKSNPFFNWLPIRALKGETLSVTLSKNPDFILNRGIYLSPSAKNTFTIGATYKPNESTPGITAEGRAELEDKASKLLKMKFEIHHHNWGIRPTTHDRRPILGAHPAHKNILIFNGLGTKGVSLAPYFSRIMATHLISKLKIPTEVNIERFKALYSNLSSDSNSL
ncbi:MAG: FAD-dependent oxidoreductase [Cyclobacteriaceae bacterium]